MARILSMTLIALLAAACVQVGIVPSGTEVVPPADLPGSAPAEPQVEPPAEPPSGLPGEPPAEPPEETLSEPPAEPPSDPPPPPPSEALLPDLVIEDLVVPAFATAGLPTQIDFTIRNVGQGPSGPFAYSWDGPGGGGTMTADGLLPGQFLAVPQSLGNADYVDAPVTILVVVDSLGEVAESDESNNEAATQVLVVCDDPLLCP